MRIGAYTVAAFTGIRLGITKIWDMAYHNFKDYEGLFDDAQERRMKDLKDIPIKAESSSWGRAKIASEIRETERTYGKAVNKAIKDNLKIESEGPIGFIKGTYQRYQTLGGYTRAKIAFGAVGSTLAAAGGLYLIERLATGHSPLHQLHNAVQAQAQQNEHTRA